CGEPVLRLAQGALREIATAVRDRDLLVRGGKTENRSANVDVDTAAYVFVFCAPLHVNGFCSSDARLDPTAAPDGKIDGADHGKPAVRLGGVHSGDEIAAIYRKRRNVLRLRRLDSLPRGADLRVCRLQVGAVGERGG